ncbi:hypothetical protein J6590_053092 [Homalodisca vitripennis]|nr:hypothetical protein J6590_053092 [Homalodisca vitripennis]
MSTSHEHTQTNNSDNIVLVGGPPHRVVGHHVRHVDQIHLCMCVQHPDYTRLSVVATTLSTELSGRRPTLWRLFTEPAADWSSSLPLPPSRPTVCLLCATRHGATRARRRESAHRRFTFLLRHVSVKTSNVNVTISKFRRAKL